MKRWSGLSRVIPSPRSVLELEETVEQPIPLGEQVLDLSSRVLEQGSVPIEVRACVPPFAVGEWRLRHDLACLRVRRHLVEVGDLIGEDAFGPTDPPQIILDPRQPVPHFVGLSRRGRGGSRRRYRSALHPGTATACPRSQRDIGVGLNVSRAEEARPTLAVRRQPTRDGTSTDPARWYPRWDSNPQATRADDFESSLYANSSTGAGEAPRVQASAPELYRPHPIRSARALAPAGRSSTRRGEPVMRPSGSPTRARPAAR
jgi:hypothetical protein